MFFPRIMEDFRGNLLEFLFKSIYKLFIYTIYFKTANLILLIPIFERPGTIPRICLDLRYLIPIPRNSSNLTETQHQVEAVIEIDIISFAYL